MSDIKTKVYNFIDKIPDDCSYHDLNIPSDIDDTTPDLYIPVLAKYLITNGYSDNIGKCLSFIVKKTERIDVRIEQLHEVYDRMANEHKLFNQRTQYGTDS